MGTSTNKKSRQPNPGCRLQIKIPPLDSYVCPDGGPTILFFNLQERESVVPGPTVTLPRFPKDCKFTAAITMQNVSKI